MSVISKNSLIIAVKNLKEKIRTWPVIFFSTAFPLMFVILFYFMIGKEDYAYSFPGMVIYATGVGTINAAIAFAVEKSSGMLKRLDTLPTGRTNIFLGTIIADVLFLSLDLLLMFIIGYGIMGLKFDSALSLLVSFFIALMFGMSALGLGLIIAGLAKNVEIANAASIMILMLMMFLSGAFFPFESPIVYFFPPFWAKQVYLQISVFGHGLNDSLYNGSLIGYTSEPIPIPIWGGLLIIVAFTLIFLAAGLYIFQKKTKF